MRNAYLTCLVVIGVHILEIVAGENPLQTGNLRSSRLVSQIKPAHVLDVVHKLVCSHVN